MNVFKTSLSIGSYCQGELAKSKSIGFVPTMGALHAGHEELIKRSKTENDLTVLSIFVNPTQFNDKKDFETYPNTLEADLKIAEALGVDVVFLPEKNDLYPDDYAYKISENDFSTKLCGQSRIGHFDGVLTIVAKLFNIIHPTKAYFGEKDFQQLKLIEGMVKAYFMPVQIIAVPTMRAESGLALSSRNQRLSEVGQKKAALIFKIISNSKGAEEARTKFINSGFEIDYVEEYFGRIFCAVFLSETIDGGKVRLIDNVILSNSQ